MVIRKHFQFNELTLITKEKKKNNRKWLVVKW